MFTDNTQKLLLEIQNFSGNKLKNINDIGLLIELSDTDNPGDLFFDILFTSKFLYGSKSVLSKQDDIDKEKLAREFKLNLEDLKLKLRLITGKNEETTRKFESRYFELNQESISNLFELISDLKVCKDYFNSLKN